MAEQHTVFVLAAAPVDQRRTPTILSETTMEIRHIADESQPRRRPPAKSAIEESLKIQQQLEDSAPRLLHEQLITMEAQRGSMVIVSLEQESNAKDEVDKLAGTRPPLVRQENEDYDTCDAVDDRVPVSDDICEEVHVKTEESGSPLKLEELDLMDQKREAEHDKCTLQESPNQEDCPLLTGGSDYKVPYHKNAINGSTEKGKTIADFSVTSNSHAVLQKSRSDSRKSRKALNVAVFLKEGQGKLLMLEKGKSTTAGEIKEIMLDNLSLPRKWQAVFSIWLISPLLELQLKDHHVPFFLRKQWTELVHKFTTCKQEEIEQDEPVIVFQRNSFLPVHVEKKISDDRVIRRLFEEAKHNILMGRYPICRSDAIMLGGILSRIEHGQFNSEVHCHGFFKKSFSHYLPERSCRHLWFGRRAASLETRLLEQFKRASECADDPKKCHRLFLEYCWALPFYGCAFFKGEVEQQATEYKPWRSPIKTVFVGINRVGITIFQHDKQEILLSLSYDELSWDYIPADDEESMDSFYLEFDTRSESGEVAAEQLQIISRQAVMMDAMVDSCVSELNRANVPKSPPISPSSLEDKKFFSDARRRPLVRTRKHNFSLSNPFKNLVLS